MHDDCDPTTFNAALGSGACVGDGGTTVDQLFAELTATKAAKDWSFDPSMLTIRQNRPVLLENRGGETHTFTMVDHFGGRVAGDVVDLILGEADRANGCVGLMVCDEQHRGVQPVALRDLADEACADGLVALLELVLPLVSQSRGSLLVARGRPSGTVADEVDRAWHQAGVDLCAEHGVRLLGFHVATRDGVFRLPEPLTAAT